MGDQYLATQYLDAAQRDLAHAGHAHRELVGNDTLEAIVPQEVKDAIDHMGRALRSMLLAIDARQRHDQLKVYLEPGVVLRRATEGSVGYDLAARQSSESRTIPARGVWIAKTGVHLELPRGMEAQVRPRSGISRNHGIVADIGTIDSDFRGEIEVTLRNNTDTDYLLLQNERIAQLVFVAVFLPEIVPVDKSEFNFDTPRGNKGHGSTGRI